MMRGKRARTISLTMVCGIIIFMSACSDNPSQETPSTPKSASKTSSTQSPESQPSQAGGAPAPAQALSTGDGGTCATLLTTKCTVCHNTTRICEKLGKKSKARWQRTVERMIERGATLTAEEETTMLDCLDNGVNVLHDVCR